MDSLSIVQLNMGRNSVVNEQLLDYAMSMNVDVALLQEPYTSEVD